ncbi:MoxR-like ATPase [Singulisphaera sp. GP187]|nr:MoxR-like ATPase [Singulisphaera sp. GP187]
MGLASLRGIPPERPAAHSRAGKRASFNLNPRVAPLYNSRVSIPSVALRWETAPARRCSCLDLLRGGVFPRGFDTHPPGHPTGMSTSGDRITHLLDEFRHSRDVMVAELNKVVIGQREVIDQIMAAIFTRGHVLLVGVPGLAKTLMVSSIAKILDVGFKRIQFTPDLMPSDITGTNVLEEPEAGRRAFRFVPGPIFSNIILADEINRTPPKTQAALLQAMQEREVTVGQETLHLPEPFFVIATQNPIEQEGTYPLPEAQLDRFMFDIRVGYPTLEEEKKILSSTTKGESVELKKVLSGKAILNLQKLVTSVPVSDYTVEYVTRLVRATRPGDEKSPPFIKELVDFGAGPRAGQNLILGGKAMAALDGRFSVSLDDIRRVAIPVLRHRISTNFQAQAEGQTTESLIRKLIAEVKEPDVPKYDRRGTNS